MRLAVDTGGTFTDLVVELDDSRFQLFKVPTTTAEPAHGVLAVIEEAARAWGVEVKDFLGQAELFVHGTTRGLNAILTGEVARTAFVTTRGHRDILLFREGGRREPFNNTRPYPAPYVPRSLTYEITERIAADGRVLVEFDEADASRVIELLASEQVDAVGVCFLWSIVNPAHERRFGELLMERLPGVEYTLSHELNPTVREYRRASATCIDASLKPLISEYLRQLTGRLRRAGFAGRPLMVTSSGGVLDFSDVIRAPIHSLRSGPAMAPVAGRHYARAEASLESAIVADAGGTSFDVSLVRRGRIPWTREAWIGEEFAGHITGFPSVDVKSIGAGGGSIAWVDAGGLLHVGPESAGADPGPACYGRGSTRPTVTDASLVLGYLDPSNFLGGRMRLDDGAAERALELHVGQPLGLDPVESAAAVLEVMTEQMVQAIEEITVRQGVAPGEAVLVAGGGSSGFNCVGIARRLGCRLVIVPDVAAGLSAVGALLSELSSESQMTHPTSTANFDFAGVTAVLRLLEARAAAFLSGPGADSLSTSVEFFAEARYPDQVWELEIPVSRPVFESQGDVDRLRDSFHNVHRETFAVADEASPVEVVTWGSRARCRLRHEVEQKADQSRETRSEVGRRLAHFDGKQIECNVYSHHALVSGLPIAGPALIESPTTTVVIPADSSLVRTGSESLRIRPWIQTDVPLAT